MIEPTKDDIGRKVVYTGNPHAERREEGVITGLNGTVVFVRYGADTRSHATLSENLEWL